MGRHTFKLIQENKENDLIHGKAQLSVLPEMAIKVAFKKAVLISYLPIASLFFSVVSSIAPTKRIE